MWLKQTSLKQEQTLPLSFFKQYGPRNIFFMRKILLLVMIHQLLRPVRSVNGVIWDKKLQDFVPIFSIPAFAAVNNEVLSQSRGEEIYDFQGRIVRFSYYEVKIMFPIFWRSIIRLIIIIIVKLKLLFFWLILYKFLLEDHKQQSNHGNQKALSFHWILWTNYTELCDNRIIINFILIRFYYTCWSMICTKFIPNIKIKFSYIFIFLYYILTQYYVIYILLY